MGGFPQSPNYLTSSYCHKRDDYLPHNKLPGPFLACVALAKVQETDGARPCL